MPALRLDGEFVFKRLRKKLVGQCVDLRDQGLVNAVVADVKKADALNRLAHLRADFFQPCGRAILQRRHVDDGNLFNAHVFGRGVTHDLLSALSSSV